MNKKQLETDWDGEVLYAIPNELYENWLEWQKTKVVDLTKAPLAPPLAETKALLLLPTITEKDFDLASVAWRANKARSSDGFLYTCSYIHRKNRKPCRRAVNRTGSSFCKQHSRSWVKSFF